MDLWEFMAWPVVGEGDGKSIFFLGRRATAITHPFLTLNANPHAPRDSIGYVPPPRVIFSTPWPARRPLPANTPINYLCVTAASSHFRRGS